WMAFKGPLGAPVLDLTRTQFTSGELFDVSLPSQVFGPGTSVAPVRSVAQVLRRLRANAELAVSNVRSVRLGGLAGTRLDERRRVTLQYLDFCETRCLPLFGVPLGTAALGAGNTDRLYLLRSGHRVLLIDYSLAPAYRPAFERVLASLRFDS